MRIAAVIEAAFLQRYNFLVSAERGDRRLFFRFVRGLGDGNEVSGFLTTAIRGGVKKEAAFKKLSPCKQSLEALEHGGK